MVCYDKDEQQIRQVKCITKHQIKVQSYHYCTHVSIILHLHLNQDSRCTGNLVIREDINQHVKQVKQVL